MTAVRSCHPPLFVHVLLSLMGPNDVYATCTRIRTRTDI